VAIIFTCLSRLLLQGSGGEQELFRYFAPLMIGGSTGYFIGLYFENWQKSLHLSLTVNGRLKKTIQDQKLREAWYVALFEKNHSILLLINSTTGRIEEANPSACEFYGYSLEQLKQMHIADINILSKEEIDYEIGQAKTEKKANLFFKHKLASGEKRDVEVFPGSILIGETDYLFLIVKDISELKVLRGVLPICAHCTQIRDDEGDWSPIEEYIQRHAEVNFSHGFCPSCAQQHYPTIYEIEKN